MKHFAKMATVAVLTGGLALAAWAAPEPLQKGKASQSGLDNIKPGEAPQTGPTVTKEENAAYKAFYEAPAGDAAHAIELGEAFLVKYPMSVYAAGVYSRLTTAYLSTGNDDKFMASGLKALELNPDNVDVLPIMAMAIPRKVNSKTTDGPQQLQKAQAYANHAIELLATLAKPAEMDDATFQKVKNDRLAMCHSGLGVADVKTGKYPDAITELNLATTLASNPDPVDFYLLGVANAAGDHFTDAIAAYGKCAANGPLQSQCKAGMDQTKKDSQNKLEAPK